MMFNRKNLFPLVIRIWSLFSLVLLALLLTISGCAKLPLDNGAPASPELSSDGLYSSWGVEIMVTANDPDGDMVTILFETYRNGSPANIFSPTSFIASGQQESFFLNLTPGQWEVRALARDEWEEESPETVMELTVSYP